MSDNADRKPYVAPEVPRVVSTLSEAAGGSYNGSFSSDGFGGYASLP